MTNAILTLNTGSSSIKYALYTFENKQNLIAKGEISSIGTSPVFRSVEMIGAKRNLRIDADLPVKHDDLIRYLVDWIGKEFPKLTITAAGHRIVHGGREFTGPVLLTPSTLVALADLSPLAPDHQPLNLAGVHSVTECWPDIPQVACFDTSFHRTQSNIAQLYALPRELINDGVIRYGFHGLSYEYIATELPDYAGPRADGRVIVAHLGHGASMCALIERKSQATSMGFTALGGLVMGQRCGDLDPGVVLYLMRERKMTVHSIEELLGHRSGLLGVSGFSSDMRMLLGSDDTHAREAVDLFVYRAVREIGSLSAAIGGLDVLVFTGGIGENSMEIRARIASGCTWLGVQIDEIKNQSGAPRISASNSTVDVFALPTDEEKIIALHTAQLVRREIRRNDPGSQVMGGGYE